MICILMFMAGVSEFYFTIYNCQIEVIANNIDNQLDATITVY